MSIAEQTVAPWRQLLAKFWAPVPWMLEAVIVLQWLLGRGLESLVIAVVAFVQE
ncbi:hypothetical protein [Thiomonas sp. FB-Cd]|uniref:hypothetical protein n=1 Tax=Thiomonas sp. FB-Cd TaxID=1158292 RepID=UPI000A40E1C2|nr:hypothetical protein [Thiomonas sp. FB-Cd]